MEIAFKVEVKPIEPKKLKVGMLVVWNKQLLQITGNEDGQWLLGTAHENIGLEPEFYPDGVTRVFQPVEILDSWEF